MLLNLSHIGQISQPAGVADRSETFYETAISLRKLYRFVNSHVFSTVGSWA